MPSSSARTTGNKTQEQRTTGSEPDLIEEDNRFNRRKDMGRETTTKRRETRRLQVLAVALEVGGDRRRGMK